MYVSEEMKAVNKKASTKLLSQAGYHLTDRCLHCNHSRNPIKDSAGNNSWLYLQTPEGTNYQHIYCYKHNAYVSSNGICNMYND